MVSKLKMKLFCNKKSGELLFALVRKDFVLVLLSVLTFPVGYFVEHERNNPTFGCIGNLYKSIDNLKDDSIETRKKKLKHLNLTTPYGRFFEDGQRKSMEFYTCSNGKCRRDGKCRSEGKCRLYFTDSQGACCPNCKTKMTTECVYVVGDPASGGGDYAYAVTDDLVLKQRSKNDMIVKLLRESRLEKEGDVEEREVDVEKAEVLKLVRASWRSNTVLTDRLLSRGKKA